MDGRLGARINRSQPDACRLTDDGRGGFRNTSRLEKTAYQNIERGISISSYYFEFNLTLTLLVLNMCEYQVQIPEPPFCLKPGCINGPRCQERMNRIRDMLEWSEFETDEDKQWQQVFLH